MILHSVRNRVGAPGIEPGLPAPKAGVLPVYYAPIINISNAARSRRTTGILQPVYLSVSYETNRFVVKTAIN